MISEWVKEQDYPIKGCKMKLPEGNRFYRCKCSQCKRNKRKGLTPGMRAKRYHYQHTWLRQVIKWNFLDYWEIEYITNHRLRKGKRHKRVQNKINKEMRSYE